ncbi:hypothetical protein LIA77_02629 [Sarocladium implicatum]|nr:hypothetical protein LIA77_02629 [Sarocladium implicatum]
MYPVLYCKDRSTSCSLLFATTHTPTDTAPRTPLGLANWILDLQLHCVTVTLTVINFGPQPLSSIPSSERASRSVTFGFHLFVHRFPTIPLSTALRCAFGTMPLGPLALALHPVPDVDPLPIPSLATRSILISACWLLVSMGLVHSR